MHGADEESGCLKELGETSVVVHLVLVVDNKRHDAVAKALAEEDEATDASVAVLEWVDALETPMVFGEGVDGYVLLGMIPFLQRLHLTGNFSRFAGLTSTNLIRQLLVVTHVEIGLLCIGSTCFEYAMELLDHLLYERLFNGAQKIVEGDCNLIHDNSMMLQGI